MESMGPDGRGWDPKAVEYDLGVAGPGESIVITISRSVMVRVLDDENYRLYKQGGECAAFQGRLHASPYRFPLPREDRWHVIIEPNTYSGIAEFTVRVLDDAVIAAGAQAPSEQAEAVQHS